MTAADHLNAQQFKAHTQASAKLMSFADFDLNEHRQNVSHAKDVSYGIRFTDLHGQPQETSSQATRLNGALGEAARMADWQQAKVKAYYTY